ncbi:MAG TPA: adenylate/guanylate cyclase domain-containing protein [Verrucomicrobiae bacterium]|nr:adenylate/guanylate cyclase domain-containing protein [Verrucomicrobiae bacterium]
MKPTTKRALVVLAICVVCTTAFTWLWAKHFVPLQELEFYAQDLQTRFGRTTPKDDRLVLIGIDKPVYASTDFSEEQIQQEPVLRDLQKNFPWSRAVWARLIQKLGDAGAKVIVFDLVFAAESDGDEQLKQALEKYKDRVVIGYNLSVNKTDRGNFGQLDLPNPSVIDARGTNSPIEDDRLGYDNVWADFDDVLRRADYRKTAEQVGDLVPSGVVLESLDARALRKFGRADLIPEGFEPRLFRYTSPPGSRLGFVPQPIGDVLSPKVWAKNYENGKFFKDKIVLIGPIAEIFHDIHDTPFADPKRQMPGPEIHLNIINAALHGEFLNEPSLIAQSMTTVMAGVCALILCFLIQQPINRLIVLTLLTAVYWVISFFVFKRSGQSINLLLMMVPTAALASSSSIALTYDYFLERLEKRRVRRTLERYVSRDVVKELLDNPETYVNAVGGVRRHIAILFSDVRNFTTMTESADPAALVKQLNEYLQEMVKIVFEHGGSLDKFIGDAVMAVWGNIKSGGPEHDARNAVATALAMHKALGRLNADWKSRGIKELAIGIGINHGEAIVGEMGSTEKVEFTAIGDPVNLASRLEGLTKEYHLSLLLGEKMAPYVGNTYILRTVDYVQVKGKTKPVDVFTVMGDGAAQTVSMPVWLARYEDGVKLYRERKFSEAAEEFQECLRKQPDDYLSSMYLKRCQALIDYPPDDSWNGVFVMTKK